MKKVVVLPSFERSLERLAVHEKRLLAKSLEMLNDFLVSGRAPFGFRLKKIDSDKFEFRVDIRLRVIIQITPDAAYLVLVADHDQIRRYLKNF